METWTGRDLGEREAELIYLLHFVEPFGKRGIRHYLGRTTLTVQERLERHRKGHGSRLIRALLQSGNDFVLASTFEGGWDEESALKKRKRSWAAMCAICHQEKGDEGC